MENDETALAEMRDRHPLPEGMEDVELSLSDVATLFKVSGNTVTDWHKNAGMPIKEVGSNGRSYVFQMSDCWAWYHDRETEKRSRQAKIKEQILKGQQELFSDANEMDETLGMSHAERSHYYEARKLWSQLEEFHMSHCKRSEVKDLLEELMIIMRDGLQSLPNRVENEVGLTPQQVSVLIIICDDMTNEQRREIRDSGLIEELQPGEITPVNGGELSLH